MWVALNFPASDGVTPTSEEAGAMRMAANNWITGFVMVLALTAAPAAMADDTKAKQGAQQVESGAKQIGQGVQDTAKGIGQTVVGGAETAGAKIKGAGQAAEPEARDSWWQVSLSSTHCGAGHQRCRQRPAPCAASPA